MASMQGYAACNVFGRSNDRPGGPGAMITDAPRKTAKMSPCATSVCFVSMSTKSPIAKGVTHRVAAHDLQRHPGELAVVEQDVSRDENRRCRVRADRDRWRGFGRSSPRRAMHALSLGHENASLWLGLEPGRK
jgi:hypothetical protein